VGLPSGVSWGQPGREVDAVDAVGKVNEYMEGSQGSREGDIPRQGYMAGGNEDQTRG
jgi:hypothetical protein